MAFQNGCIFAHCLNCYYDWQFKLMDHVWLSSVHLGLLYKKSGECRYCRFSVTTSRLQTDLFNYGSSFVFLSKSHQSFEYHAPQAYCIIELIY